MKRRSLSLETMLKQLPRKEQSSYRAWANQLLREAMETVLTTRQQEILYFYYECGLNLVQIAKALHRNPSTICRTKQRALQKLEVYLSILPK